MLETASGPQKKRKSLIVAGAIVVTTIAMAVACYYGLRNTLTDRLEFIFFTRGTQLSNEEAAKLEKDVRSDPGSFASRIELLAFYNFKTYKDGLTAEDLAIRRKHILWVIENQPTSKFAGSFEASFGAIVRDPEGLAQGKNLWLKKVNENPRDVRILYNASMFFFWVDDRHSAEDLCERAYAIDPADHKIASALAGHYWKDARYSTISEQSSSAAKKALNVFGQALADTSDSAERIFDLPEAAQAAFEARDYEKASSYSHEALSLAAQPENVDRNADAIHYGNIVLGRIALQHGDVSAASAYLVKAAAISGSPHLETYGPNMMLTKELLEKGERKSPMEYLDLCGKFWKDDNGKLSLWRSTILSGKNPDFGDNLRY